MKKAIQEIKNQFQASIDTKKEALNSLPETIFQAADLMTKSLQSGHKILTCGNGGSACDALHFATEILNRFMLDRPSLPAMALTADTATLTAIANDYNYDQVFSKQVSSLGQPKDILLAISTSGNSNSIVNAIKVAQQKSLNVVALTGKSGGKIAKMLTANDIEIRVPQQSTPRIQETHVLIIHCLCEYIERTIFSPEK